MTIAAGFKVFFILIPDSSVSALNIFTCYYAKNRKKI